MAEDEILRLISGTGRARVKARFRNPKAARKKTLSQRVTRQHQLLPECISHWTAMSKKRLNCWDFKKCGREPNGVNVQEMGVCPAAVDDSFDGINGGANGGRICWAIAGTLCEGQRQGAFHSKRQSCVTCDFFKSVSHQESESDRPTKLLNFLIDTSDASFLGELAYKWVKAGERFLSQGVVDDTAYIIQKGTCMTVVEKDGFLHPAGHWSRGDIVGIRGLFTGEPHEAHVEAETDMHLWVLRKHQIDTISSSNQDLLTLVTEIVASQFDSKRPVADREIGKYIATDIIGRGGYSIVYKAVHRDLKMVVAIKMMRHNMVVDSSFLENFRHEAQLIASLSHRNILKVYDFEERYRTVFIVSEFLEGESLEALLRRLGRIPQQLAIKYILQICNGLAYAHGRGIIHRDIHADNIMVLPDDRVKILDFGLACPLGTDDEQIGGKLTYQAPELLEGSRADCRTDIYSLGITAFELLTGKIPFSADDIMTIFRGGGPRVMIDPATLLPEIMPKLRQIIMRACHHDRNERYHTVPDLIYDLELLQKHHPAPVPIRESCRNGATVTFRYSQEQQRQFEQFMEELNLRAKSLGIDIDIS